MIDEIYSYWFGNLSERAEYFAERNALWFGGSDETDREIRNRFGHVLESAILPNEAGIAHEFLKWTESDKGTIALIVLIDQFSLQLLREKPESYERSALMIPIVKSAIERGVEKHYALSEKAFLYMPLEHSENIADQELSVRCFKRMVAEATGEKLEFAKGYLDYAERHARVVKRFGRFPDRNEVYGRKSTDEELKFLASDEAPF